MRLQKALAAAGVGSRRACEEWIKEGRVTVNGVAVTELGAKADPEKQKIAFDGRAIRMPHKRYYIALNKPKNVMCSLADAHAAKLVTDLVEIQSKPLLRPVGRLDSDTEGLIFLTDDGDFLYHLTHPKKHVPKTYRAQVKGVPSPDALKRLARGVMLDDGMTAPAENVRVARSQRGATEEEPGQSEIELTIYEGRNRQVRRMLAAVGHPVTKLERVRIGAVGLSGLPRGAWRHLTPAEVAAFLTEPKPTQETKPWAAKPLSTRPRASSSPNSPRPKRQSPRPTSLNSPRRASTTD